MSKKPNKPSTKSAIIDVAVLDARCRVLLKNRETLADDAHVSYKTVQRAAAGHAISYTYIELIADALGIPPYQLVIKVDAESLAPTGVAANKKRLAFAGELDVSAEMFAAFEREGLAFKFFAALYLSDLIKDGAANIRLIPGSVLAGADLTLDDIGRLIDAFSLGSLEPQRVISLRIGRHIFSAKPFQILYHPSIRNKPWNDPEAGMLYDSARGLARQLAMMGPAHLESEVRRLVLEGMPTAQLGSYLSVPQTAIDETIRTILAKLNPTSEPVSKPVDKV